MLYYGGKPLLRWDCRDRRVLEAVCRSGSAPSPKVLLGRAGTSTYWKVWGLTSLARLLAPGWLRHRLVFADRDRRSIVRGGLHLPELVRGCHLTLRVWPWGHFKVKELLLRGEMATCVEAGRLRYYLCTTGDPYVLLGRCNLTLFGREIFLGHVVVTQLGG